MKKTILYAFVGVFLSTGCFAALDWSGETRVRYRDFQYDDGLNSSNSSGDASVQNRNTYEFRSYLKNVTKLNNNWTGEFAVRTTGSATSYYTTVTSGGDANIGIELANAQWKSSGEVTSAAVIGRQKVVFDYDRFIQNLWDNDLRLDGIGGKFERNRWGLNAGVFVLGAQNQGTFGSSQYNYTTSSQAVASTPSGMSYVMGLQPTWKWSSDKINVTAALGHYRWMRATGYTNRVHMGYNSSTLNPAANTGTVNVHNPRQWQGLVNLEMPGCKLKMTLEWLQNKKMFYGNGDAMNRAAWAGSIAYREAKKQGDWSAAYGYAEKGLASGIAVMSSGDIAPDTRAHVLDFVVMPADQLQLGASAYFSREKSRKAATGIDLATSQDQKARALYFTAGVKF